MKFLACPAPTCWSCAGTITTANPPAAWVSAGDLREPGLFGVGVVCRNCTRDGSVAIVRGGHALLERPLR